LLGEEAGLGIAEAAKSSRFGNFSDLFCGAFTTSQACAGNIAPGADHGSAGERRTEMSQIANLEMWASIPAARASTGSYNFVTAAELVGVVLVLIAAQLIFAGSNLDVLKAAADAAASGIISP
jgi:hypothetical protein